MLANLQQLQERLEKEFYLDNIYEMASICHSLALDALNPVPFFAMESVFLGIGRSWQDIALTVEEANMTKSKLIKPMKELVRSLKENTSSEETLYLLNELVSAYLTSFK